MLTALRERVRIKVIPIQFRIVESERIHFESVDAVKTETTEISKRRYKEKRFPLLFRLMKNMNGTIARENDYVKKGKFQTYE